MRRDSPERRQSPMRAAPPVVPLIRPGAAPNEPVVVWRPPGGPPRHLGLGAEWLPTAVHDRPRRLRPRGKAAAAAVDLWSGTEAERELASRVLTEWRLLCGRATEVFSDDEADDEAERVAGVRKLRLLHSLALFRRMKKRRCLAKWLAKSSVRLCRPEQYDLRPGMRYPGLGRDPIHMVRQSLLNSTTLWTSLDVHR